MISNYLIGCGVFYRQKQITDVKNIQKMIQENQIDQLKRLINEELKNCSHQLWPQVCQMQSTEKGLARLQEMVIRLAANDEMGIGSAIALIEQELSHNLS